MKSKVKASLIFIIGLLLGSIATLIVFGKITMDQYAVRYSTDVIEQAILASEIRAQRHEELAKHIENSLPSYVLAIHQNKELREARNARQALWRVKEFYDVNSIPVPNSISGILNELPPEPPTSCEIEF